MPWIAHAKLRTSADVLVSLQVRQHGGMVTPPEPRFAGVLAHHHNRLILVREDHPRWGGAFWNIPSGMVEALETPAEGAVRELREETGLEVAPEDLRLQTTSSVTVDGTSVRAWNFAVDVVEEPVIAVRDPDNLIQEARWFPLSDAVELLRAHPWRPLSEPAIAMLTGAVASGTHWTFAEPGSQPTITASVLD